MNHYSARRRAVDERWDFTCKNNGDIWPVGYCCKYRPIVSGDIAFEYTSDAERAKYDSFAHKYHTGGHDTPEAAAQCYKEYLLDHHLRLRVVNPDAQHKCQVCGGWTQEYAEVDMRTFDLCPAHNTREEVEKLFKASTEIWSS